MSAPLLFFISGSTFVAGKPDFLFLLFYPCIIILIFLSRNKIRLFDLKLQFFEIYIH